MHFIANEDSLVVKLQGWEVLLGLRRKIIIPRSSIISLTWQPEFRFQGSMFRVGGTGLPTVLYAGHFRGNGQRYYLYMHQPRGMSWTADGVITAPHILDIQTVDFRIARLLLTCNKETADKLIGWWQGTAA
jgi:hypothetical protein